MTTAQSIIMLILLVTIGMFLWGRWRHDMVALGAMLACVFTGLIEAQSAFNGFGHPAVITVACVLVLSRALQSSGAVDVLTRLVLPANTGPTLSIAALTVLAALLSGFMNNVGALALLMPVAIQVAQRLDLTPGQVLMPLAFGTILGGMTTLIGTPPNLIVSSFRAQNGSGPFAMFDFSPVGVAVAVAGVLFIIVKGDVGNLLAVRFTVGDGWIVGAAISWVVYSVLLRRWPDGSLAELRCGLGHFGVGTACQFAGGALVVVLLPIPQGDVVPLDLGEPGLEGQDASGLRLSIRLAEAA